MSTKRLAVRDALAALVATATGLEVVRNLDFAVEGTRLPAAAISSGDDEIGDYEFSQVGVAPEVCRAQFVVHLLVESSTDPESSADALEESVRAAVSADMRLGGAAMSVRYTGGSWSFDLGDFAARRLVFLATFIS